MKHLIYLFLLIIILSGCRTLRPETSRKFDFREEGVITVLDSRKDSYSRKYYRRFFNSLKLKTRKIKLRFTDSEINTIRESFYENELDNIPESYGKEFCAGSFPNFTVHYQIFTPEMTYTFSYDDSAVCEEAINIGVNKRMKDFHDTIWVIMKQKPAFQNMKRSNIVFE